MSKLKTGQNNINNALYKKILARTATQGVNFLPQGAAKWAYSAESRNDLTSQNDAEDFSKEFEEVLKETYLENGEAEQFDDLTDAQKQAAVIAMQATEDPEAYHQEATRVGGGDAGFDVSSDIDSRAVPAMEAFDSRNIKDYIHYSPVFNLKAARQDAFGELFYPTLTTTPDRAGYSVTIQRTMVHNEYNHIGDGAPAPETFMSKSLIDATLDHRVLTNDSTRIYPLYDGSNPYFSENIGETEVEIGNVKVKTAPLKIGKKLNLLSISHNATLDPMGVNDMTDSLDGHLGLEALYLKVTGLDSADTSKESFVKLKTLRMPLSEFQKSAEGYDRDMTLSFRTVDVPLHAGLKAVDGSEIEALGKLAAGPSSSYVLRLAVTVTGVANLETGNIEVNTTGVEIDSIWDTDSKGEIFEITDEATITSVKEMVTGLAIDSYDIYARRSNLNRRQRGLLVRVETWSESYPIPLGSPITALKPITDTATLTDISGPIEAARKLNSNNAVTKLIEYGEALNQYKVSMDRRLPVPKVEGIGRLLVRPYYEHIEFDLQQVVDSPSSHERAKDIRGALIEIARDRITKAANATGYLAALEATGGGKPVVAVGTAARIHRYLIVDGDTRMMSDAYDYRVETSSDLRMVDKIFLTFIRPDVKEPDGLGFGNMVWIPELVTDVPNSRGGAQARELMVQPRVRHVNHLPILIEIDVKGLDEVTEQRVGVKTIS